MPDTRLRPQRLETLTACPLCDSKQIAPAPTQPHPPFGIQQCANCGGIFLSPRPPLEEMKHYYDEYYEGDESRRPKADRQADRARRHIRRLMRYVDTPGRVLDVGAGDGCFLNVAREAGWQVEGLELSQPRVDVAKQRYGLDLKCCSLEEAPFPPGSFDAIGMFQLIEHVHDPNAVFRRASELLKTGGVLELSTPNVLAYARKNRDVNSWRIPRHLYFFTPRTLVRTAERCGFQVLRRQLAFFATLEERLGWHPWTTGGPFSRVTRDLWTPFGLQLIARKK